MTEVPKELQDAMGVGMEDVDQDSMPIIKILQKSSAELDDTHKDHAVKQVPGGKAGDLYFISESLLLGKEAEIIPLSQNTLYAEWRPKSQGGGIVGHHPRTIITDSRYRKGTGDTKYKEYLDENELKLTIYFFVLLKVGDEWKKAILPFTSSNLKHGRSLSKQISGFRYEDATLKPSIFSRSFTLKTQLNRNDDNSWYEFDVLPARILDFKKDKDLLLDCVAARSDAVASLPQPQEPKGLLEGTDGEPF